MKHNPAIIFEKILPTDVIYIINSFIPKKQKNKKPISPSMQNDLKRVQTMMLKGKNSMYLRDLDDFCLD